MSYYDSLNSEQKRNIQTIIDEAKKVGVTNPYALAGVLAIVSKESSFVPKSENMNYSSSRISQVWPRLSSQASSLANNPEKLANAAYGGRYGNATNEGYKYRGRGFNQLTFKDNYKAYAKLANVDIVNNPDSLNDPKVASKVLIAFTKKGIDALSKSGKLKEYNASDINDFKNVEDATMAMYHVTAGTGKSVAQVKALKSNDSLGGMTKALSRVSDLFNATKGFIKKKPILTIAITTIVVVAVWALIKYSGKEKKLLKTI